MAFTTCDTQVTRLEKSLLLADHVAHVGIMIWAPAQMQCLLRVLASTRMPIRILVQICFYNKTGQTFSPRQKNNVPFLVYFLPLLRLSSVPQRKSYSSLHWVKLLKVRISTHYCVSCLLYALGTLLMCALISLTNQKDAIVWIYINQSEVTAC